MTPMWKHAFDNHRAMSDVTVGSDIRYHGSDSNVLHDLGGLTGLRVDFVYYQRRRSQEENGCQSFLSLL